MSATDMSNQFSKGREILERSVHGNLPKIWRHKFVDLSKNLFIFIRKTITLCTTCDVSGFGDDITAVLKW